MERSSESCGSVQDTSIFVCEYGFAHMAVTIGRVPFAMHASMQQMIAAHKNGLRKKTVNIFI